MHWSWLLINSSLTIGIAYVCHVIVSEVSYVVMEGGCRLQSCTVLYSGPSHKKGLSLGPVCVGDRTGAILWWYGSVSRHMERTHGTCEGATRMWASVT